MPIYGLCYYFIKSCDIKHHKNTGDNSRFSAIPSHLFFLSLPTATSHIGNSWRLVLGPNSQVRSRFTRALETFEWSSRTKRKILILELVRHGVRTASRIRHACSIAKSLFSLISQSTAKYDRKLDVLKNAEFSK